jgi:hypothetical protein
MYHKDKSLYVHTKEMKTDENNGPASFNCQCRFLTRNFIHARAAWRSGHRISLRDSRPGVESRQGISFWKKTKHCLCVFLTNMNCLCVEEENKGTGPINISKKKKKKRKFINDLSAINAGANPVNTASVSK